MDALNFQKTCLGGGMKLSFLELSSDERRLYIEQAAIQRNISPVIMEKDFWVCWLLGILENVKNESQKLKRQYNVASHLRLTNKCFQI